MCRYFLVRVSNKTTHTASFNLIHNARTHNCPISATIALSVCVFAVHCSHCTNYNIHYCARFAWQMFNLPAACYYNFFFCQFNNKSCALAYDTIPFCFCVLHFSCFSSLLFYICGCLCKIGLQFAWIRSFIGVVAHKFSSD